MKQHFTTGAPNEKGGAFSRVIVAGDTAYVGGSSGLDRNTPDAEPGDLAQQFGAALRKIGASLEQADFSLDDLVSLTVFLVNDNDWARMGTDALELLAVARPTITVVRAAGFVDRQMLVEISAIAVKA